MQSIIVTNMVSLIMPDSHRVSEASFRFYAGLNFFLPPGQRFTTVPLTFKGRQTVKHLIESLGVPHPEVDVILANGISVPFNTIAYDGDRFAVYPPFTSLAIPQLLHLAFQPLPVPRFILDCHLGRLAAYLRMLGFDASYQTEIGDNLLAELAVRESRILLTRDRALLKRKAIQHGYCPRSADPLKQLIQVVTRYDLKPRLQPFTRCMACNGQLKEVEKSEIQHLLEPRTRQFIHHFNRCPDCGKIYWRGHHTVKMEEIINSIPSF